MYHTISVPRWEGTRGEGDGAGAVIWLAMWGVGLGGGAGWFVVVGGGWQWVQPPPNKAPTKRSFLLPAKFSSTHAQLTLEPNESLTASPSIPDRHYGKGRLFVTGTFTAHAQEFLCRSGCHQLPRGGGGRNYIES